jgi:hypothetical protein
MIILKLNLQRVKNSVRKVAYSYENGNEFQCELRNRFEDGADEEERERTTRADHECERLKEAINQAAKVTLTRKPRVQKKAWLDTFALKEQKRNCARAVWSTETCVSCQGKASERKNRAPKRCL